MNLRVQAIGPHESFPILRPFANREDGYLHWFHAVHFSDRRLEYASTVSGRNEQIPPKSSVCLSANSQLLRFSWRRRFLFRDMRIPRDF